MSIKTKLLTSVAALSLIAGAAVAQENTATAEQPQMETAQNQYAPGWNQELDNTYGDIADQRVAELIGMNVVTESGDDVGEVDNFVIMEDRVQAIVGVGGFLGLGEHEVALPLDELAYDGERLIISYTQEELEAMPEYTEELEQTAFAEDDTFRTRTDMDAFANATGDLNPEADTIMDKSSAAIAESGDAVEEGAAEVEQMAKGAADATENALEEGGEAIADATEATGDALEEGAAEAEQMAKGAADATENALENGAEAVADATEATGDALEEGAVEAEQMADNAVDATSEAAQNGVEGAEEMASDIGKATGVWAEKMSAEFAAIADAPVNELTGYRVVSTNGEDVGEIDNFGKMDGKVVAIVGIGGLLGLGEHDVALDLVEMNFDGEKFITPAYTEEELKALPEYDAERVEILPEDTHLRASLN